MGGVCRLADRGVIRASGVDAAAFLQGQLTNDVASLGPGDPARNPLAHLPPFLHSL